MENLSLSYQALTKARSLSEDRDYHDLIDLARGLILNAFAVIISELEEKELRYIKSNHYDLANTTAQKLKAISIVELLKAI